LPKASQKLLRCHFSAAGTATLCAGAPAGSILSPVLWSPCVGRAGSTQAKSRELQRCGRPRGGRPRGERLAIHGRASLCSDGTRQVRGLRPPRRELGRREPAPPLNSQTHLMEVVLHAAHAEVVAWRPSWLILLEGGGNPRSRFTNVITASSLRQHSRPSPSPSVNAPHSNLLKSGEQNPGVVTGVNAVVARVPAAATPGRVWLTVSTPSSWRLHVSYNDPNKRGPSCTAATSGGFVRLPLTQRGALERSRVCQR